MKDGGVATNDVAKSELEAFGITDFDYPKPVSLIKYLISFYPKEDFTVLDFFAGTGTTLQSVLELNEISGNRKCILVSNAEKREGFERNIARDITFKRCSKVIKGYKKANGDRIPGKTKNNLRYYESVFVDRKPTLSNKRKLTTLATELLCIKEDTYKEVTSLLEEADWHRLFTDGKGKYVYIVFDDLYIDDAVELLEEFISKHQPQGKVKVYVFSNGQYAYTEEFESLAEKVELAALPDAIYKALAQVLPKENREDIPELEDEVSENETAD